MTAKKLLVKKLGIQKCKKFPTCLLLVIKKLKVNQSPSEITKPKNKRQKKLKFLQKTFWKKLKNAHCRDTLQCVSTCVLFYRLIISLQSQIINQSLSFFIFNKMS